MVAGSTMAIIGPMQSLVIDPRFNGPDGSANGGYACGAVAALVGRAQGPTRVRLQRPPPLGEPMEVREGDEPGTFVVEHQGQRVAVAAAAALEAVVPAAPSMAEATAAQSRYRGHRGHIYPRCFVCGPGRAHGDGMRVFAGAVPERDNIVACDYRPTADTLDDRGHLHPTFAWAALDCPSYFALDVDPARGFLLGQMTAEVRPEVPGNRPLIVYAWRREQQGRKHGAAAALADEAGTVWARAEHVWIELRPA